MKPIKEDTAKYFGGHLKYPLKSGGLFDFGDSTKTGIIGKLKLYEDRIEFEHQALRKSKRWKIVIPFERIDIENVEYIERDSGTAVAIGGGMAGPGLIGPMGVGGGLISKVGDMVLLVIPYTDENGIKHAPRFQIKGVIRDKTQEWAEILYDKIAEVARTRKEGEITIQVKSSEDEIIEKLKKLKELYDAGILTDEEFEEKKRRLLSNF